MRRTLWDIARKTNDPDRALYNLLERDRLFTDWLRNEVLDAGARSIDVDGSTSEDALAERIGSDFGLA